MPAHKVLPLTAYIFEASHSTSATQANKILEYGPIRTLKSISRHWSFNVLGQNGMGDWRVTLIDRTDDRKELKRSESF